MRVAAFSELIGPDGVSIEERDDPRPEPSQAVVDVEACAINRHDLWILQGDSAMVDAADLPFVSGLDVAGVVERVGEDCDVDPGDRVVLCPNQSCGTCRYCREGPENRCVEFSLYHGGLAEEALVSADRLVRLPDGVGPAAAAALPTAYVTAWHMIRRAGIGPGDRVLVPGATGGVGVAAIQLLGVLGARSVGSSRSAERLERVAALGADHTIESDDPEEMADEVLEVGETTAVLNHLGGGGYLKAGLRTLERGGRMVVCGRTAGDVGEIDVSSVFLSHHHVIGSTMGTQPDLERLVEMTADGALEPVVDGEFDLEETAAAFAAMQEDDTVGKLIVRP
ncbi:alcohol dehydrogenase catalytic domain-containing protein [Halalkalicoccus ordinarius]|uniref:alcohol dehydrogenase catalytic domain-containing protein n=1 Tax=Halalkalicoccus ordinarius TaxID=3116651 RepID=UPI00300EDCE7